jgi:hypothetical protein
MHNTAIAMGFAALLLVGACASHNAVATEPTDEVVQVTQTEPVVSTPSTATDSDGNVIAEPGTVSESTVTVTNAPLVEPGTTSDTTATALTTTTTTTQTTTVPAPVPAPMTSSSNLDTQTTTSTDDTTATTETETRTRLRKD